MTEREMTLYAAIADRLEIERGPLNIRLRRALSSSIDDSILGAGEVLPPERELAEKLQISRSTVRQCLKSLVEAGVLRTIPGIGTTVIGTIPKALSRLSGFSQDMMLRGLVPSSKVLELNFGPVLPEIAFRTGMPLGTRVLTLARLRLAGGETLSYERAVVPVESVGEDFDGAGSLYERMDARGYRPRRILQTLEAKEASTELSQLLGIDPGAAVLKIAQVGYGENATAVEDAITWYRGDRYKYVGEITA